MFKIRDKEDVLKEYEERYPELDSVFIDGLSKEYNRYVGILKNLTSKEEAMEVFAKEIERNESNYKDNSQMKDLEGSPHSQYMSILANYGLIVFFRDHMLE